MSINRVSISGNLTRDPKLRQTQGVTAILSLGVAVNDRRRNPRCSDVPLHSYKTPRRSAPGRCNIRLQVYRPIL